MVYSFTRLRLHNSPLTLMQIGVVVQILVDPPPVIVCFLGQIFFRGHPNGNTQFLVLAQRPSIVGLLML